MLMLLFLFLLLICFFLSDSLYPRVLLLAASARAANEVDRGEKEQKTASWGLSMLLLLPLLLLLLLLLLGLFAAGLLWRTRLYDYPRPH